MALRYSVLRTPNKYPASLLGALVSPQRHPLQHYLPSKTVNRCLATSARSRGSGTLGALLIILIVYEKNAASWPCLLVAFLQLRTHRHGDINLLTLSILCRVDLQMQPCWHSHDPHLTIVTIPCAWVLRVLPPSQTFNALQKQPIKNWSTTSASEPALRSVYLYLHPPFHIVQIKSVGEVQCTT